MKQPCLSTARLHYASFKVVVFYLFEKWPRCLSKLLHPYLVPQVSLSAALGRTKVLLVLSETFSLL